MIYSTETRCVRRPPCLIYLSLYLSLSLYIYIYIYTCIYYNEAYYYVIKYARPSLVRRASSIHPSIYLYVCM